MKIYWGRILGILILLVVTYNCYVGFKKLIQHSKLHFVSLPKQTNTYHDLFNSEGKKKLDLGLTFYDKFLDPRVTFLDKSHKYSLVVFRYPISNKNTPLDTLLNISEFVSLGFPKGHILNSSIKQENFDIFSGTDPLPKNENFKISIQGEKMLEIARKENILEFQARVNKLAIQSSSKKTDLVYIENKKFSDSNLINILLLKKVNYFFIILKLPIYNHETPNSTIYQLLDNKNL